MFAVIVIDVSCLVKHDLYRNEGRRHFKSAPFFFVVKRASITHSSAAAVRRPYVRPGKRRPPFLPPETAGATMCSVMNATATAETQRSIPDGNVYLDR